MFLTRIIFWAAMAFAIVMATLPHVPEIHGVSDKVQHIIAFCVMTVLAIAAYPRTGLLRIAERMTLLGAVIEVLQSIPALHRDCDIMDLLTDVATIGGVVAIVLIYRLTLTKTDIA